MWDCHFEGVLVTLAGALQKEEEGRRRPGGLGPADELHGEVLRRDLRVPGAKTFQSRSEKRQKRRAPVTENILNVDSLSTFVSSGFGMPFPSNRAGTAGRAIN